jgi:predicted TIM-barrel fold metal-dependent hydrolase
MNFARLSVFLVLLSLSPLPAISQPLVDHHQHLFSSTTVERAPTLQPVDAGKLIELLDAAGIRRAAVLSIAYGLGNPNRPRVEDEYGRVRAENDWTSQQVARFPDRLRGFCSFNPLKEYALAELERCAADPNLKTGIKLHIGNSDVDLENAAHLEKLQKIFLAADTRGMAIVVHLRSSVSRSRPYGAKQAYAFINDVMSQAPRSVIQIAHLAGAGGYEDPRVDEAMGVFIEAIRRGDPKVANLYFDVSGVAGLGNWKKRRELIAQRVREVGLQRILFGSDGFGGGNLAPRDAWEAFKSLPLTEAEIRTIEKNVAPYLR